MKTEFKKETILSVFATRVLLATSLTLICLSSVSKSEAQAATPDNDPNLAPPSAGASAAMQATGGPTIVLKGAAAASAPADDQPADAAPAVVVPAAPAPAAAVLKPDRKLTEAEYLGYSFALKNVDGASFDEDMGINPVQGVWKKPLTVGALTTVESKSGKQLLSFNSPILGRHEVATIDKTKGQATLTVFKDKKPESYTVFSKTGNYTATPGYCELLRVQTQSASFAELQERAVTCKAFYDRTPFDPSTQDGVRKILQGVIDTHRRNASTMKKSVAGPVMETFEAEEKARQRQALLSDSTIGAAKAYIKETPMLRGIFNLTGRNVDAFPDPIKSAKPRSIITNTGSPEEIIDRAVLSDLGEACGRLWRDADGKSATAAPAPPRASGGATKP